MTINTNYTILKLVNINQFLANAIKAFRALSLPMKIVVSVVGLAVILSVVSQFNYSRFQQKVKENTTPHNQPVDVTKVPAEVKAFLSDENLQKMDEAGMNIYTGDNPPNIEGSYEFKNQIIKYDQAGGGGNIIRLVYKFEGQKDDNTINFSAIGDKDTKGEQYLTEGKGVFISGEGNCFSIYLEKSDKAGDCDGKSVDIFSACKTNQGLIDMDQGTLWTYRGDKCSEAEAVPAGYLRIFSQKTLAPSQ